VATAVKKPEPRSAGGPLAAIEDWRDSRRMRRHLRRGAVAAAAGGLGAPGLRYETKRHGRRGLVVGVAVALLVFTAVAGAVVLGGSGGSKATASPAQLKVANHTAGTAPAASLAGTRKVAALRAVRERRLAALRKERAAALHEKRVAAFKARRAAAHHAKPAAKAPASTPAKTTPVQPVRTTPSYTPPATHYTAPSKPAPKPKSGGGSGKSFDLGG
jgi:hypothetical protein